MSDEEHVLRIEGLKKVLRHSKQSSPVVFDNQDFKAVALELAADHDQLIFHIKNMHRILERSQEYIRHSQGYINLQPINEDTPKNGLVIFEGPPGLAMGQWKESGWWSLCGTYFPSHKLNGEVLQGVQPLRWALIAQGPENPLMERFNN